MTNERRLPRRAVSEQTIIVERTARQIGDVLKENNGLIGQARTDIREIMDNNLGELEYFVLVREDSFGEIHTNRLREGIYFKDPVGVKCALVSSTTAFFYPRNTGEQLIDVSTPVYLDGKKVYSLRSGRVLQGISRHVKIGVVFILLQIIGILGCIRNHQNLLSVISGVALLLSSLLIISDRLALERANRTWIRFMRMIGKGDLKSRLSPKSRDEFGQMQFELNKMCLGVADIIQQVEKSTMQVASTAEELSETAEETTKAAEQIALTIQEVSMGTEQQAAAIEVSADAMNQIVTEIQRISDKTQTMCKRSIVSSEVASKGTRLIQTAIGQVTSINTAVLDLTKAVTLLGQRSEQIAQIVDVMSEIASKTNLLALNASIEAARAGESGKGFAVVAAEVKKLAEQSTVSAKNISDLVRSIQRETDGIVGATDVTTKEVETGIRDIHMAGKAFEEIELSVKDVVEQIQTISQAVQKLSVNSDEIVSSIGSIAKVVDNNNTESQQVSAAAEEQLASMEEVTSSAVLLSTMSGQLQNLISRFQV